MNLSIKVNILPETINGEKYYFWIIINNESALPSNHGFGWEKSINKAFLSAKLYCEKTTGLMP